MWRHAVSLCYIQHVTSCSLTVLHTTCDVMQSHCVTYNMRRHAVSLCYIQHATSCSLIVLHTTCDVMQSHCVTYNMWRHACYIMWSHVLHTSCDVMQSHCVTYNMWRHAVSLCYIHHVTSCSLTVLHTTCDVMQSHCVTYNMWCHAVSLCYIQHVTLCFLQLVPFHQLGHRPSTSDVQCDRFLQVITDPIHNWNLTHLSSCHLIHNWNFTHLLICIFYTDIPRESDNKSNTLWCVINKWWPTYLHRRETG